MPELEIVTFSFNFAVFEVLQKFWFFWVARSLQNWKTALGAAQYSHSLCLIDSSLIVNHWMDSLESLTQDISVAVIE